MLARDPAEKTKPGHDKTDKSTNNTQQHTWYGATIQQAPRIVRDDSIVLSPPRRSLQIPLPTPDSTTVTFSPIPGRCLPSTRAQIISQTALHAFVTKEALFTNQAFIPRSFGPPANIGGVPNYAHFASLMVHPVTGETILSYKQLMHDLGTSEIWQTVFGKDFDGMAHGDAKMGQKGMNSMFVMN